MAFAIAIPYGYSDLLKDLREARHLLMQDDAANFRYDEGKGALIKKLITAPKANPAEGESSARGAQATQGQGAEQPAQGHLAPVLPAGPGADTQALRNVIEIERDAIRREGQLQLQGAENTSSSRCGRGSSR